MKRNFILEDIVGLRGPQWADVTSDQLTQLPWSSIARVDVMEGVSAVSRGTGWLVSSHTLVTAAHVVDLPRRPAEPREILLKFKSLNTEFLAEEIEVHPSYVFNGGNYYDLFDIAAIRLSETRLPSLAISSQPISQTQVELAGFPLWRHWADNFVTHSGQMIRPDGDRNILLYQADTKGGHSGAPVVVNAGTADAAVIGIHVQPFGGNPFSSTFPRHNVGLVLSQDLVGFITNRVADWG